MSENKKIIVFEDKEIRKEWNEEEQDWYVSVVDVVGVLTDQPTQRNASTYWAVLKKRLLTEGAAELLTNCKQLKLKAADGKMRMTDVANTKEILRIIQSVPSPKAEPFKMWLTQLGKERIDEVADPEIAIDRAKAAREQHEARTGKKIVSPINAKNLDALKEKDDGDDE